MENKKPVILLLSFESTAQTNSDLAEWLKTGQYRLWNLDMGQGGQGWQFVDLESKSEVSADTPGIWEKIDLVVLVRNKYFNTQPWNQQKFADAIGDIYMKISPAKVMSLYENYMETKGRLLKPQDWGYYLSSVIPWLLSSKQAPRVVFAEYWKPNNYNTEFTEEQLALFEHSFPVRYSAMADHTRATVEQKSPEAAAVVDRMLGNKVAYLFAKGAPDKFNEESARLLLMETATYRREAKIKAKEAAVALGMDRDSAGLMLAYLGRRYANGSGVSAVNATREVTYQDLGYMKAVPEHLRPPPGKGIRCGTCIHFSNKVKDIEDTALGKCGLLKDSKEQVVHPHGCCNFYQYPGQRVGAFPSSQEVYDKLASQSKSATLMTKYRSNPMMTQFACKY